MLYTVARIVRFCLFRFITFPISRSTNNRTGAERSATFVAIQQSLPGLAQRLNLHDDSVAWQNRSTVSSVGSFASFESSAEVDAIVANLSAQHRAGLLGIFKRFCRGDVAVVLPGWKGADTALEGASSSSFVDMEGFLRFLREGGLHPDV